MAISIENADKVRQKARIYVKNPTIFYILKAFFLAHSQRGNADLQLVTLDDADLTGTDGVVAADAACTVYVVWLKKRATATDSYLKLYDDATDDTTAGNERVTLAVLEASEDHIVVFPQGLTMATGVVATSHTTANGTTDSTAGDSGDGFIIIGATGTN